MCKWEIINFSWKTPIYELEDFWCQLYTEHVNNIFKLLFFQHIGEEFEQKMIRNITTNRLFVSKFQF